MSELKYKWILYLISGVILATLAIQGYWTYKNYLSGKQQLINDVQVSLDTAIDQYYTQVAKEDAMYFFVKEHFFGSQDSLFFFKNRIDSLKKGIDSLSLNIKVAGHFDFTKSDKEKADSTQIFFLRKNSTDTLKYVKLVTKTLASLLKNDISLESIDSILQQDFIKQKNSIKYSLLYTHLSDTVNILKRELIPESTLKNKATSHLIPKDSSIEIFYGNVMIFVLKKNLFGIFLSFVLLSCVVASLLYLLKIIKNQKKLSEMKSDLISNITHEFKTPIATIGVAMEGITGFNLGKTDEKTHRYAQITSEQIKKLNVMVEKLLETASLDSSELTLNKEQINLNDLIFSCVKNHSVKAPKSMKVELPEKPVVFFADAFHFENAMNNVIDNAIKYGGSQILISLKKTPKDIEISISDSGTGLTEEQKHLIFDKFYRVPKGNVHDIKGFGIGLYYTKKIIEKHRGKIWVDIYKDKTSFKIRLPYA